MKKDLSVCIKHEHREVESYKEWAICTEHNNSIKSAMEIEVVKPHARDQSNNELAKSPRIWLIELSKSSINLFLKLLRIYI